MPLVRGLPHPMNRDAAGTPAGRMGKREGLMNTTKERSRIAAVADLRRAGINQFHPRALGSGRALLHPLIEILQGGIEHQAHEAGFH